jgi:uracil-DNA glycosylase
VSLSEILFNARSCTQCSDILQPRPVLRLSSKSRILIIGQAPGSRVHDSGRPWDDASGEHLIEWLGVSRAEFDDPDRFGILPMAFCYPGKGASGDNPPPPVCAQTWHEPLREALDQPALVLLIGMYAQKHYLARRRKKNLTETVRAFEEYGPSLFPLPHPSWRSRRWITRNPWFTSQVLPALKHQVSATLQR